MSFLHGTLQTDPQLEKIGSLDPSCPHHILLVMMLTN